MPLEAASSLRFRNALVFLRHQLRSSYVCHPRHQQCRTSVNTTEAPVRKGFGKDSVSKFVNQGLGDMKSISHPTKGLMNTFKERGFIGQFHGDTEEFSKLADEEVLHIYAGADPTASSLHIGHLMVIMPMLHCMLHGHRISFVVGVATARVGDPSDRAEEREGIKDKSLGEKTYSNGTDITTMLSTLLKNFINHAASRGWDKDLIGRRHIKSNLEWFRNVSVIDFMQIVGHRSRVGEMMSRKSVTRRLASKEGLSYSEFSYQLIQATDYWHLFSSLGVRLQIGGSDQWGNITAGCDLINRHVNEASWIEELPTPSLIRNLAKPYGLTVPLLTTAAGEKFSKSSITTNNIWLSGFKTPPFALYQYLLNRPDDVMEQWLKWFTILPLDEISTLMAAHHAAPEKRLAQHKLAFEVISLIHSEITARQCAKTTTLLLDNPSEPDPEIDRPDGLTEPDILDISKKPFWIPVRRDLVLDFPIERSLVAAGITPSNTQARNLLQSGAVSIGPHLRPLKPSKTEMIRLTTEDLIADYILIFKIGKNTVHILRVTSEEDMPLALEEHNDPKRVLDLSVSLARKTSRQARTERKKLKKQNLVHKHERDAREKKEASSRYAEKESLKRQMGVHIPDISREKPFADSKGAWRHIQPAQESASGSSESWANAIDEDDGDNYDDDDGDTRPPQSWISEGSKRGKWAEKRAEKRG